MGIEMALLGLGGAALGAGGNIWSANEGRRAQENATNLALGQQRQSQQQATNLLMPFIQSGQDIMPTLRNFIDPNNAGGGLNMLMRMIQPGADQNALLEQTPGYAFNRDQGNRAVMNRLSARGLGGSAGAVTRGVGQYTSGLAASTWRDVVDRLQGAFTSGAGAMQGYANMGAGAAGSLANGIMGMGNNMANNMTGLGNAQAASYGQMGDAMGGFGNNVSRLAMMQGLGSGPAGGSMYGGLGNGMPFNNTNMGSNFFGPLN